MLMEVTTLDKIFEISYGSDLELNKLNQTNGTIRFISRTRKNNGLSAYVNKIDNLEPNPANTISVALGSSSVLFAFLQEEPYYSGRDIAYLTPRETMTRNEMLFYCTCITYNRFKYNYGRQANKTIASLKVPDKTAIPEWVYSTTIQDLSHLDESFHNQKIPSPEEFRFFNFLEIFEYVKEEVHTDVSTVNLVSALTDNNGIKETVTTDKYIEGNNISISSNGIYTGTAFYQSEPFVTQDSIGVTLKDKELNKYIALYLLCLINNEKFRFNYGRKSSQTKLKQLKLKLPTKDGQPDWTYMEQYIKSLPYSKNI